MGGRRMEFSFVPRSVYTEFVEKHPFAERRELSVEAVNGNRFILSGLTSDQYDWLAQRVYFNLPTDADLGVDRSVEDLGMGPDAPITQNEQGGSQSEIPYDFATLDPRSMLKLAEIAAYGDAKYGADNWRKIPVRDHLNHMIAHAYAYLAGDETDEHLAHAMTRSVMAHAVHLPQAKP